MSHPEIISPLLTDSLRQIKETHSSLLNISHQTTSRTLQHYQNVHDLA